MKRSLCCPFQVSFSPFSCSSWYSPSELYTFRINRRGSCWHEDGDYSDRIGKLCGGCCNSSNHVPFDFDAGVFWGLIYVCSFGPSLVPMSPRVFKPTLVNTHTHTQPPSQTMQGETRRLESPSTHNLHYTPLFGLLAAKGVGERGPVKSR